MADRDYDYDRPARGPRFGLGLRAERAAPQGRGGAPEDRPRDGYAPHSSYVAHDTGHDTAHDMGQAAPRARGPVRAYRDHHHHHGQPYAPPYGPADAPADALDTDGYGPGVPYDDPTYGAEPGAHDWAGRDWAGRDWAGADWAGHDAPPPSTVGVLVNWAGALVSLGLVVGMGVWAWQLTTRDVSGVPVIQALEGPMRVAPDDPGGAQAPNQGLTVNRIAEGQEAAPAPDRVVLAPPPVDLDAAPVPRPVDGAPDPALLERVLGSGAPLAPLADPPVTTPVAQADPATDTDTDTAPAQGDPVETAAIIPASVPGVARSLRPQPRPAAAARPDPVASSASTADTPPDTSTAPVAGGVTDLSPADLPAGTRLVQLGAFDTDAIARSEWDRLTTRFPDFMAGRARVIEQASSGGAVFYRLRAHGFDDLPAARRFCTALVAQGAACIPVTVR